MNAPVKLYLTEAERAEMLERLLAIHRDAMALYDAIEADTVTIPLAHQAINLHDRAGAAMSGLADAVRRALTRREQTLAALMDRPPARRG